MHSPVALTACTAAGLNWDWSIAAANRAGSAAASSPSWGRATCQSHPAPMVATSVSPKPAVLLCDLLGPDAGGFYGAVRVDPAFPFSHAAGHTFLSLLRMSMLSPSPAAGTEPAGDEMGYCFPLGPSLPQCSPSNIIVSQTIGALG